MLQVTSIEHLKQLSNINGRAEFYDDTYQSNLTEKALYTKTNIPEAIKNGVFYYHGVQLWGI
jgi:hypothetical protein